MDKQTSKMSQADALLLICLCAIQVDERIKAVELRKLVHIISLNPMYSHIKDPLEYLSALNKKFFDYEIGEVIDESIGVLTQPMRETAYAWACEVVIADSGVSQEEHTFLKLLVKKMGLHGELAGKISAVVAILNRKE